MTQRQFSHEEGRRACADVHSAPAPVEPGDILQMPLRLNHAELPRRRASGGG